MTGSWTRTSPGSTSAETGRPRASVIVLNYNGGRHLDACLGALRRQELEGGFEVVLVDNGSSDGSVERARRDHAWVRVIEAGRNLGFAAANNLGFRVATGRHLVVLNNDTRVRRGWLPALVAAAESDERVGAVTSKLVFADRPEVIQNAGLLLLSDGGGADRGGGEVDRGQYERVEEVFGFCGAAALLRREALGDAGQFDETFFAYYEDTDLSWRMRRRGWSILYQPAAVVEHVHSATSVEGSAFFLFHSDRNRLFTLVKNASAGLLLRSLWAVAARVRGGSEGSGRPASPDGRPLGRVAVSFSAHLPEMLVKRLLVRSRARVSSRQVERWLYPRSEWDARSA